MNAPTPMFFYVLYALPFVVAAVVLIASKYLEWRAARDAEVIEKPTIGSSGVMIAEVRSKPMRRHYASYATTT